MPYSTRSINTFLRTHFKEGNHNIRSKTRTELNDALETYIGEVSRRGWERTTAAERSTIRAQDIDIEQPPESSELTLSMTRTRDIAETALPDDARLSKSFVLGLTALVEEHTETIVVCSEQLMIHADRKTLLPADIELYFSLFENLPQ